MKSPLNHLTTLAIGALLWVVTAVFLGDTYANSLSFTTATPEAFLAKFRIFLAIAAVIGVGGSMFWFYYGSLDKTAGDLDAAKRVWWGFFISNILSAVVLIVVLVITTMKEGIKAGDYSIMFCFFALHTIVFYWFCSFFFSPRNVKYCVLGR